MRYLYADDTQIYGFCSPDGTEALQNRVTVCISDVDKWMVYYNNRLQLNAAKTEVGYSGVLQTVSNTSSQVIHFLSAEILSSLQSLFAIWEYFWTATCVHEDSRVADCIQLFCSSATDTQHPSFRQSSSFTLSSPRWCCRA